MNVDELEIVPGFEHEFLQGKVWGAATEEELREGLEKAGVKPRIMIDCSHANSGKDHRKQGAVCRDVSAQLAAGERRIMGVMIESNLVAGSQTLTPGKTPAYGQSITDACIDWTETVGLLRELATAVQRRREFKQRPVRYR